MYNSLYINYIQANTSTDNSNPTHAIDIRTCLYTEVSMQISPSDPLKLLHYCRNFESFFFFRY